MVQSERGIQSPSGNQIPHSRLGEWQQRAADSEAAYASMAATLTEVRLSLVSANDADQQDLNYLVKDEDLKDELNKLTKETIDVVHHLGGEHG